MKLKFATLTNLASYANTVAKLNMDYSAREALVGAPPTVFAIAPTDLESTRYSDELRLASSPGRVEWLLGGFYTHEKVFAANGAALPYSAKFNAAAMADYRITVFERVVPRVGLTYAHRGSQNTSFTTGENYKLPSYDTLDLRGGIDWSGYSIVARIDNVANKFALTDATPTVAAGSPLGGIVLKPPLERGVLLTIRAVYSSHPVF